MSFWFQDFIITHYYDFQWSEASNRNVSYKQSYYENVRFGEWILRNVENGSGENLEMSKSVCDFSKSEIMALGAKFHIFR